MKDSGIEWIGNIPDDWETTKLKYLTKIKRGASPRPIDNFLSDDEDAFNWVRIGDSIPGKKYISSTKLKINKAGSLKSVKVKPGDLIMSNSMSIGRAYIMNISGFIHDGWLAFSFNREKVNGEWLSYALNASISFLERLATGSTVNNLNIDRVKSLEIPFYNIHTQKKIVSILDYKISQIDSIVEHTKLSIEKFEEYKKSLISETVTKGLNPNVEMKNSEIAWVKEIPKHWEVISSKRLFSERKERASIGERQLTASQKYGIIYQDEFMQIGNQNVVTVEKDFSILKQVKPNDFVISMRSFQGGLEYSHLSGSISSAYVMLIPNEFVYSPYFRWLLKSSKYISALRSTSNLVRDGQAMRYFNFIKIPLFIIPLDEQKQMADFLDSKCSQIDSLIEQKQKLLKELENYKKTLIYEYVTGKKEVL